LRDQRNPRKGLYQVDPRDSGGEEITYDYCLYDGGEDAAICNCAAKKCRGTMYSKEEVRRRKRAAKKAASVKKVARKKREKSGIV